MCLFLYLFNKSPQKAPQPLIYSLNVILMLGQGLQRWPNV